MAKQIKFTVGGYFGGCKTIEIAIDGEKISYKLSHSSDDFVARPASFAKAFNAKMWLAELEELKIFSWDKNYSDPDVLDGTQWSLTFKDDEKIYEGGGSNAYPENWLRFLIWINELCEDFEPVQEIKFTVGNAAVGYKTVEVSTAYGSASYKILRNGLLDVDKKISVVEVSAEWLEDLDALNIFDWAAAYSSAARGGEQWELIFKDGDKIYRGHGSNAYPENWERFLDWLDALVPELEFVDRQRLEKITLDYSRESGGGFNISERLTLDRRENILTLYKPQSMHVYRLDADIDKIFAAAQIVFGGLKADDFRRSYPAQIKIELIRHDGSIENFDALFNESSLPGFGKFVDVLKEFITDLTTEILSPVPAVIAPAQGKYIFCKVQFKGSYKHYTYQTDDETLAVGDVVDVPVGKNNDVNQARIVEIGYFDEYEAPFPVDRIKKIIGKHVATEWDYF